MNITLPTIHMNGTSARDLTQGYADAMRAVSDAQEALRKIEFNQRDYYPQGDAAWKKAHEEQMSRFKRLNDLHAELETIAIHCSNFVKP